MEGPAAKGGAGAVFRQPISRALWLPCCMAALILGALVGIDWLLHGKRDAAMGPFLLRWAAAALLLAGLAVGATWGLLDREIEVAAEGLLVRRRRGTRLLRWDRVLGARESGRAWEFRLVDGSTYVLECGFMSPAEFQGLCRAIESRLPEGALFPPAPRIPWCGSFPSIP